MARPEWSYEEEDDAGDPASTVHGYRAAPGSNKYASQETAAGVFGGRTSSERPRPRPVPRRGGPPQRPRPLPKPIVLLEPVATPAAIPVPGVKSIRWVGRNEATAGPPGDGRPAGRTAPGPAPAGAPRPASAPRPMQPATPFAAPQPPPGFVAPPKPSQSGPRPVRSGFPAPAPTQPDDLDWAPRLSVRPLRTPAPAVTTIRVAPEPVDGFEYETASLWFSDSRGTGDTPVVTAEPEPLPPPSPTTPSPTAGTPPRLSPYTTKSERTIISWLDE